MKSSILCLLIAFIGVGFVTQSHSSEENTKKEVRRLRAEASYLEIKGDLEGSLSLYEQSLELMPDAKIETRVTELRDKLGIDPSSPGEPAPQAISELETTEAFPLDQASVLDQLAAPTVTSGEASSTALNVPESEENIKATPKTDPLNEKPVPGVLALPGAMTFPSFNTRTPRVERIIGTAIRDRATLVRASEDFETLFWDQREEIDGEAFHRLFINGIELELPQRITWVGFAQITRSHDFVLNVNIDVEDDSIDDAVLLNGALIGPYYRVTTPVISSDRSTWAVALIEREQDPETYNFHFQSTLLVNGQIRIALPFQIEKVVLSPDGSEVAFSVHVSGSGEHPEHDRFHVGEGFVGPEVDSLYHIEWDSMGKHVFWLADSMRDDEGRTKRLLFRDGEIISEHALSSSSLVLDPNSTAFAFEERRDEGKYLVTADTRFGPWERLDDVIFGPDGELSWVATKDAVTRLYIRGEPVGPEVLEWYGVREIVWSPDGNHWVADVRVAKDEKIILLDGRQILSATDAGGHVFSPNNERVATWVTNASKDYAIAVDGTPGPWLPRYETEAPILFSPDSKHCFYWAVSEDRQLLLYRDHQQVPSEGDIAPNLYFDEKGVAWFYEVVGDDPSVFHMRQVK